MINWNKREAFLASGSDKQIIIEKNGVEWLTNTNMLNGTFSLTERLCTAEQLEFGGCEASELRFTIFNDEEHDESNIGEWIWVFLYVDGDKDNKLAIGKYRIESDKPDADRETREIVAYDDMYRLSQMDVSDWYNSLWTSRESMTLREFCDNLGHRTGYYTELLRGLWDVEIRKAMTASHVTATDILKALGKLQGCFYGFDRGDGDGQDLCCRFVGDATSSCEREYETGDVMSLAYEDYMVRPITKVVVRDTANSTEKSYGDGNNVYYIENNILLNEEIIAQAGETIARNVWNVLESTTYVPVDATVVGDPCVEVGDCVDILHRNGVWVRTVVLERTLTDIQGMKDNITANGSEYREASIGIDLSFKKLNDKSNLLERELEYTRSEIKNSATKSELEQTADALTIQIDTLQKQIDGEVAQFEGETTPTLDNYPAADWNASPMVDITEFDGDAMDFIYTDKEYAKHARALYYNTANNTSYRFIKDSETGQYVWLEISDTEYGVLASRVTTLEVREGAITAEVDSVRQQTLSNTENIRATSAKAELTEQGLALEIDQRTKGQDDINVKMRALLSGISFEVTNGNTTSSLKMTATKQDGSKIELASQEITLGGDVVFKNNLSDGSTIISGDNIKTGTINADLIKAGTINADLIKSGTITGRAISGGSININNKFKVDANGNLTAMSASLTGTFKTGDTYGDVRIKKQLIEINGEFNSVSMTNEEIAIERNTDGTDDVTFIRPDEITTTGNIYAHGKKVLTESDTEWTKDTLILTSGNKVINAKGYKTLVLHGRTGASGNTQSLVVPIMTLGTSTQTFAITQGSAALTATLSINSKGELTIAFGGSGLSTGAMWITAFLQK